ncbi:hypothetical protein CDL15_Pgr018462 [Punica granatum]|uniref:Uncharacterized protein n=1 Tax=Punica granatum TaxID=22663 RepID=A0A218WZ18_PUNGR|nr:hypothetical protein CDL15_Pgr018462 [Punica granatum]
MAIVGLEWPRVEEKQKLLAALFLPFKRIVGGLPCKAICILQTWDVMRQPKCGMGKFPLKYDDLRIIKDAKGLDPRVVTISD